MKKFKNYLIVLFFLAMLISPIIYRVYFKQTQKMVDLSEYTINETIEYAETEKLDLSITKIYSNAEANTIIYQSIKKGAIITKGDKLVIKVSLGYLSDTQLKQYSVNELGDIPIILYHGIISIKSSETGYTGGNVDINGYNRTIEAFIKDLEYYYENNYRMISLDNYINGEINTKLGKSPIVITFDGGSIDNFNVTGLGENNELIIDSNSAISILESYKTKYPDYLVTATFLLTTDLFNQPDYDELILDWLIENDYSYIVNGESDIYSALQNGRIPSYSPFNISFNINNIERCKAWDNNGKIYDIEMNFKTLKTTKYVSDGNLNTIAYPKIDEALLKNNQELKEISY